MHIVRNVPIFFWWAGVTAAVLLHPSWFVAVMVAIMLGGPLLRWIVRRDEPQPIEIPHGLSRYSSLHGMTSLSLVKAALAHGALRDRPDRLSDRS